MRLKNILGRRLDGFLGLSLNDGTILFLVVLWDKTREEKKLRREGNGYNTFLPRIAIVIGI